METILTLLSTLLGCSTLVGFVLYGKANRRIYSRETEINRLNERIIALTEERDKEKLLKEKYKEWHCRSSICVEGKPDPKGRRPPNPKIVGKEFSAADEG